MANTPVDGKKSPTKLPGSASTSVGGPRYGHLVGGVALPLSGPGFRFNPRRDSVARYGTVEVVGALMRAAAVVQREMPGSELTINDLSLQHGGPIAHHGSHRAGRDADVLFYLLDDAGKPIPSVGAPLDPDGRGVDFKDLADPHDDVPVRLDVARTWRFVRAVIEDPVAHLQRIFIAEHLRTILLDHARSVHAPARTLQRFAMSTCQPSYPHDDHMHFRFFCTPEDIRAGCEDSWPIYPWQRRYLRHAGVRPVIERRRPRAPEPDITTEAEAEAQAGPMDKAVVAWLKKREAWMKRPHPGRPYCH